MNEEKKKLLEKIENLTDVAFGINTTYELMLGTKDKKMNKKKYILLILFLVFVSCLPAKENKKIQQLQDSAELMYTFDFLDTKGEFTTHDGKVIKNLSTSQFYKDTNNDIYCVVTFKNGKQKLIALGSTKES